MLWWMPVQLSALVDARANARATVSGVVLRTPPGSILTQLGLPWLTMLIRQVALVVEAAGLGGTERVLDLYCGMGNLSLPLACRARAVVGVEEGEAAVAMARKNAAANSTATMAGGAILGHTARRLEFHSRPAEGALSALSPSAGARFDVVVLDPPRSGALKVCKELVANPVQKVVMVSCDTGSLARDLAVLLAGGYRLQWTQPVDMFPQTSHCESVTALRFNNIVK
jgi:23S rRNA (uracil1939-C5)-methyltransferase